MPRPTVLRVLLAFVVSAGLLALLLSQVDAGEALSRIAAADPGHVAASFVLYTLTVLLRGHRFAMLAPGAPVGVVVAAVAVQQIFLRVLPLRLGELALPWVLREQRVQSATRALIALVLVRLLDLVVVAALLVAGALVRAGGADVAVLIPAAAILALLLVALAYFRALARFSMRVLAALASRTGLGRRPRVEAAIERLAAATADLERLAPRASAGLAASAIVIFVVQAACFSEILLAYGVPTTVAQLAVGSSAAALAAAIPVASVGSIGTLEAGWAAGFAWAGVPLADAVATAIGAQILTLVYCAALALPAFLYLRRRQGSGTPATLR